MFSPGTPTAHGGSGPRLSTTHPVSCTGRGLRQARGRPREVDGLGCGGPDPRDEGTLPGGHASRYSWGQALELLSLNPRLLCGPSGGCLLSWDLRCSPRQALVLWSQGRQWERVLEASLKAVACSSPCFFYHPRPPTKGCGESASPVQ